MQAENENFISLANSFLDNHSDQVQELKKNFHEMKAEVNFSNVYSIF